MIRHTKEDIQRLGLHDPIVRALLDAQRLRPGISWEQMLTSMVVHLAEAKAVAEKLATDYASRLPPEPITLKDVRGILRPNVELTRGHAPHGDSHE